MNKTAKLIFTALILVSLTSFAATEVEIVVDQEHKGSFAVTQMPENFETNTECKFVQLEYTQSLAGRFLGWRMFANKNVIASATASNGSLALLSLYEGCMTNLTVFQGLGGLGGQQEEWNRSVACTGRNANSVIRQGFSFEITCENK